MDLQHDIDKLLANGFFMTSRNKSPVRSSTKNSFYQKSTSVQYQQSRRNRVCPPRPIVEDELVSISREASPPLICYDPPLRGTIDQNPIILDAEVEEVKTTKKTVKPRSQPKDFSVKRESRAKLTRVNFQEPPLSKLSSVDVQEPASKLSGVNHRESPLKLARGGRSKSPSQLSRDNFRESPLRLARDGRSKSPSQLSRDNFRESPLRLARDGRSKSPSQLSRDNFQEPPYELANDNLPTTPSRLSHDDFKKSPPRPPHDDFQEYSSELACDDFPTPPSKLPRVNFRESPSKLAQRNLHHEVPAGHSRDWSTSLVRSEPPHSSLHKKSKRSEKVKPKKISSLRKIRPELRISARPHCTSPSASSICRTSSFEYLPSCGSPWENLHDIPDDKSDTKDEETNNFVPASPLMSNLGSCSYSASSPDTPDSDYYYDSRNLKSHANHLNERLIRHVQRSEKFRSGKQDKSIVLLDDHRFRKPERHTSTHSVRFARNLETEIESIGSTFDTLKSNHSRSPRRIKNHQSTRGLDRSYRDASVSRPSTPIPRRQDYQSSGDDSDEYSDSDYFRPADNGHDVYEVESDDFDRTRRPSRKIQTTRKEVRNRSSSRINHGPSPDNRRRFRINSRSSSPQIVSRQLALVDHFERPEAFPRSREIRAPVSRQLSPFTNKRDFYRSERRNPIPPPPLLPSVPPEITTASQLYRQRFDPQPSPIHSSLINYQEPQLNMVQRFSERTEYKVPLLHPCSRTTFSKDQGDWFTLPDCPDFDVCPSCFQSSIAPTQYGKFFVISRRTDPDTEILCDLGHSSWYRIAWLMLNAESFRKLEMFYDLAIVAAEMPPCENEYNPDRKWCSIIDPWTGTPIRGFEVCLTCVNCVLVLLPELRDIFVPIEPYSTSPRICSLRHNSKRFIQYFDCLEVIAAKSRNGLTLPDVGPFAQLARHLGISEKCQQDNEVYDHHWHIINLLPEFTVCEECFTEVVLPLINEGNSIALMFENATRRLPQASCQLYSHRMTEIFRMAAATDDYSLLVASARERKTMELKIKAHCADLRRRRGEWGTNDEITKAQKEWTAWE